MPSRERNNSSIDRPSLDGGSNSISNTRSVSTDSLELDTTIFGSATSVDRETITMEGSKTLAALPPFTTSTSATCNHSSSTHSFSDEKHQKARKLADHVASLKYEEMVDGWAELHKYRNMERAKSNFARESLPESQIDSETLPSQPSSTFRSQIPAVVNISDDELVPVMSYLATHPRFAHGAINGIFFDHNYERDKLLYALFNARLGSLEVKSKLCQVMLTHMPTYPTETTADVMAAEYANRGNMRQLKQLIEFLESGPIEVQHEVVFALIRSCGKKPEPATLDMLMHALRNPIRRVDEGDTVRRDVNRVIHECGVGGRAGPKSIDTRYELYAQSMYLRYAERFATDGKPEKLTLMAESILDKGGSVGPRLAAEWVQSLLQLHRFDDAREMLKWSFDEALARRREVVNSDIEVVNTLNTVHDGRSASTGDDKWVKFVPHGYARVDTPPGCGSGVIRIAGFGHDENRRYVEKRERRKHAKGKKVNEKDRREDGNKDRVDRNQSDFVDSRIVNVDDKYSNAQAVVMGTSSPPTQSSTASALADTGPTARPNKSVFVDEDLEVGCENDVIITPMSPLTLHMVETFVENCGALVQDPIRVPWDVLGMLKVLGILPTYKMFLGFSEIAGNSGAVSEIETIRQHIAWEISDGNKEISNMQRKLDLMLRFRFVIHAGKAQHYEALQSVMQDIVCLDAQTLDHSLLSGPNGKHHKLNPIQLSEIFQSLLVTCARAGLWSPFDWVIKMHKALVPVECTEESYYVKVLMAFKHRPDVKMDQISELTKEYRSHKSSHGPKFYGALMSTMGSIVKPTDLPLALHNILTLYEKNVEDVRFGKDRKAKNHPVANTDGTHVQDVRFGKEKHSVANTDGSRLSVSENHTKERTRTGKNRSRHPNIYQQPSRFEIDSGPYNVAIELCGTYGIPEEAWGFVDRMLENHATIDTFTITPILKAYMKNENYLAVCNAFRVTVDVYDTIPNQHAVNMALSAAIKTGRLSVLLQLFDCSVKSRIDRPDHQRDYLTQFFSKHDSLNISLEELSQVISHIDRWKTKGLWVPIQLYYHCLACVRSQTKQIFLEGKTHYYAYMRSILGAISASPPTHMDVTFAELLTQSALLEGYEVFSLYNSMTTQSNTVIGARTSTAALKTSLDALVGPASTFEQQVHMCCRENDVQGLCALLDARLTNEVTLSLTHESALHTYKDTYSKLDTHTSVRNTMKSEQEMFYKYKWSKYFPKNIQKVPNTTKSTKTTR
eukprot:CFRG2011T1